MHTVCRLLSVNALPTENPDDDTNPRPLLHTHSQTDIRVVRIVESNQHVTFRASEWMRLDH